MSAFLNAAEIVLKRNNLPMHYKDITELALREGLLTTKGKTPAATMGSVLGVDIRKHGHISRFTYMGSGVYGLSGNVNVGTLSIKSEPTRSQKPKQDKPKAEDNIDKLLRHIQNIDKTGRQLENIIKGLLEEMDNFSNIRTTSISKDKGIDLVVDYINDFSQSSEEVVIQVKNYGRNKITSSDIRDLRGSARLNQQCWFITTTDFTTDALDAANESGFRPVRLTNGRELAIMLINHNIGIKFIYPIDDSVSEK